MDTILAKDVYDQVYMLYKSLEELSSVRAKFMVKEHKPKRISRSKDNALLDKTDVSATTSRQPESDDNPSVFQDDLPNNKHSTTLKPNLDNEEINKLTTQVLYKKEIENMSSKDYSSISKFYSNDDGFNKHKEEILNKIRSNLKQKNSYKLSNSKPSFNDSNILSQIEGSSKFSGDFQEVKKNILNMIENNDRETVLKVLNSMKNIGGSQRNKPESFTEDNSLILRNYSSTEDFRKIIMQMLDKIDNHAKMVNQSIFKSSLYKEGFNRFEKEDPSKVQPPKSYSYNRNATDFLKEKKKLRLKNDHNIGEHPTALRSRKKRSINTSDRKNLDEDGSTFFEYQPNVVLRSNFEHIFETLPIFKPEDALKFTDESMVMRDILKIT